MAKPSPVHHAAVDRRPSPCATPHRRESILTRWLSCCLLPFLLVPVATQSPRAKLRAASEAILAPLFEDDESFAVRITGETTRELDLTAPRVEEDGRRRARVEVHFQRLDRESFAFRARTPWAEVELRRSPKETVLFLPARGVVFRGAGPDPRQAGDRDSLGASGFLARLLGDRLPVLAAGRMLVLGKAASLPADEAHPDRFRVDRGTTVRDGGVRDGGTRDGGTRNGGGSTLVVESADEIVAGLRSLALAVEAEPPALPALDLGGAKVVAVERAELERMVFRALRRLLQTYVPGLAPGSGVRPRVVEHGELRRQEGQRLVLLHGTPAQIGRAHGELLGELVQRTVDSCLYLVGLVETVREGRWFPAVLDEAWQKLSRHIPERQVAELDALADAVSGLSRRELRLASVFPEYFHCSGFALFGKATKDGRLYHGRVLDYMTMIGLQHAAVTFVIKPDRGHGFLNVGYAGFTGCVTGMNERQLSLGEMGGRGRFQWDGVPMATLMRRALEECGTLEEVKALWRDSPRTCEYFYVFADGKPRGAAARAADRAVGVAATPEKIEFLEPGASHPRLGEGIADTVLLSAGSRLTELRRRVRAGYGGFDADAAIHLMDRPVAMRSNLHNALMAPSEGAVWIAHATADRPAAEGRYVRYSLAELLGELPADRRLTVRDSLEEPRDGSADALALLRRLHFAPGDFAVEVRPRADGEPGPWHRLVTFPSPQPAANGAADRVVLEWYRARRSKPCDAIPAVLVLHILDGRMRVARGVARVLANQGFHAFVMHLPGYGRRAQGAPGSRDVTTALHRMHQAVADACRARDAIAALPGVDPRRISLQGTSLGGFVAALAGAVDGRFRNTFLMLTGGDLPAMFEHGERDTAKIRRALEQAGIHGERLDRMLRDLDPLRLAHRLPAERTWLYSARSDQVVPPANAQRLAAAAGLDGEHHLWFPGDHYTVVLQVPLILQHMVARLRADD